MHHRRFGLLPRLRLRMARSVYIAAPRQVNALHRRCCLVAWLWRWLLDERRGLTEEGQRCHTLASRALRNVGALVCWIHRHAVAGMARARKP